MPRLNWLVARPIAHRGLHGNGVIENTLAAAAAAIEAGYGIEVDLRLTADGEAVVFHDTTLDRLTTATGPVAVRTATELKGIAFRDGRERIPTLGELLDLVAGRTPLVLELKSRWDGDARLARRVAAVLTAYAGPVAAMSFDPDLVEALQEPAPCLARGLVAEQPYSHPDERGLSRARKFVLRNLLHLRRTKPHFVAYRAQDLPSAAPLIARHLLGLPLLTWTVRSEAERRRLSRWADQVIFEGFRP